MRFQLFSDLHIELSKSWPKPPKLADILVLAGDIGKIDSPGWKEFMGYCDKTWSHTFYVLGNHEFYHHNKNVNQLTNEYKNWIELNCPNIHLLDNCSYELDGIIFYGFVGWTRSCTEFTWEINDYYQIWAQPKLNITPPFINGLANDSVRQFKEWVCSESTQNKSNHLIVITHFPPIRSGTSNPKYLTGLNQSRIINKYFAWDDMVETESIPTDQISLWISGHTHWSYDFVDNNHGIRYLANQAGYRSEVIAGETGFDCSKIYEV